MISVGNDIVSLESACLKRFSQKEYYSKILSAREKNYFPKRLDGELSFAHYVWLLWSIKEAAYKYFKRIDNNLLFNPLKIEVDDIFIPEDCSYPALRSHSMESAGFLESGFIEGHVILGVDNIRSKSIITKDFIFSIAADEKLLDKVFWGIQQIEYSHYKAQSETLRFFTERRLKNLIPDTDLRIEKDSSGVPFLLFNDMLCPVSFTHDGPYIAYSFLLQTAACRISLQESLKTS